MATVKLTLDTRSIKKDGTHPVKLYVSHRGEDFFISTNISIKVENWKGKENEPTKSKSLNSILNQILVQTQAHIYKLRADGKLASMVVITELKNFGLPNFTRRQTKRSGNKKCYRYAF